MHLLFAAVALSGKALRCAGQARQQECAVSSKGAAKRSAFRDVTASSRVLAVSGKKCIGRVGWVGVAAGVLVGVGGGGVGGSRPGFLRMHGPEMTMATRFSPLQRQKLALTSPPCRPAGAMW